MRVVPPLLLSLVCWLCASGRPCLGAEATEPKPPQHIRLHELRQRGTSHSQYLRDRRAPADDPPRQADLTGFANVVKPVLDATCTDCHGADTQEAGLRIDTLDPNLFRGNDVDWWLEVLSALSKGEMPPPDDSQLDGKSRRQVVDWLTTELQHASRARRAEGGHTSFRRMTRYETNYALQDLLGLPFQFAKDLPPEPVSEDGFLNSSETLHMSSVQLATYRQIARQALLRATVRGERPQPLLWGVSMEDAAGRAWAKQEEQLEALRKQHADDPDQLAKALARQQERFRARQRGAHYKDLESGRAARIQWSYGGAKYAHAPTERGRPAPPPGRTVAILPPGQRLIVELGNRVPDRGPLRVRVRATAIAPQPGRFPRLQLEFGWQASNDSSASVPVNVPSLTIDAEEDQPRFFEWRLPLGEVWPRNLVRRTGTMGRTPSPSEYIKLVNNPLSRADIQIDYVEVTAPVYDNWPPAAHRRLLPDGATPEQVLRDFMRRAWRRPITSGEVQQKLTLLEQVRPACQDEQEALVEVLSTVLASPNFLYVAPAGSPTSESSATLSNHELAMRLSLFLWCSMPDETLLALAEGGTLSRERVLREQVDRMLRDPRAQRLAEQFVRQWLGLALLDYLDVDRKAYPEFDAPLKTAMQQEPVATFAHVLQSNASVLDFLHADYSLVNERLANHYGIPDVVGEQFRRVRLGPARQRGGYLTQAGLLAMNSDGKDSHPLKRSIWLLERMLNDPPPPPPPAVPEIDLTDPEILKLTLKQRIEDHRNQPACLSCHAKIDPWGIAFENYDALGNWRSEVRGQPVDARSRLPGGQSLDGMEGLKGFLLEHRQDQFVRALVAKMTTFALGRQLRFADRAGVDAITRDLRRQGDGLATMVTLVVTSDLFRSR